jgi:hypothetical protein
MYGRGGQSNRSYKNNLRAGSLIALCCAALLGCGSGAPGTDVGADGGGTAPSCTPFVACGGDLTGTWNIANTCLSAEGKKSLESSLKLCEADSTSVDSTTLHGTVIYDGHGAVEYDIVGALEVSQSIPTSCLEPGQQCPAYVATLIQTGATNARCDATAAGCDCSYTLPLAQKQQNSYVARGTTVTETDSSDGTMSTDDYCVDGSTLRVKSGDQIGVATR